MNEATTIETKRYQCRHIFTDGHRCGSICLRGEPFCYYHHTTRKPAPRQSLGRKSSFDLPLPEDRSAIQASIGIILQKIASNDLDPKRAGLLLYGLQIASLNLPKQQRDQDEDAPEQVHEITTDPELGTLAPQTEIHEKKSFAAQLLEELRPKPAVLPQIQATEDTQYLEPSTQYLALEKSPFSQIANKPKIRSEEIIASKRRQRSPLHIIEDAVVQVSIELVDDEELQVDRPAVAVLMADAGHAPANGCGDTELLVKLANQRLFGRLPGLDLASGKLPFQAHRLVRTALADQHFGVAVGG
jgi:hypothetical protein